MVVFVISWYGYWVGIDEFMSIWWICEGLLDFVYCFGISGFMVLEGDCGLECVGRCEIGVGGIGEKWNECRVGCGKVL